MSRTKGKRFADKKTAKQIKKSKKQKRVNATESRLNDQPQNVQKSVKFEKTTNIKNKKSKGKNFIFNLIIIICVIAILFSSYKIFMWFLDNRHSKELLDNIRDQVSVSEEQITIDDKDIKLYHYDLTKLLSQNSDTVGWINVSNTNIDYPVVQSKDNDFYLNHSFDKSQNSAGWVFADYRSDCNPLGYNTVIYGHNRKDQSMFGSLQTVLKEEWYSKDDNLYIHFSTVNEDHVYRVFSTFVCNDENVASYTKTDFSDDAEFKSYLQKLKSCSSHDFETDISESPSIITLYTCYGINNQRLLVCAVLVK